MRSKIANWEKSVAHKSDAEKQMSLSRIDTRRKLQQWRKGLLTSAEQEFAKFGPLNINEPWPKIVDRFEQVGEGVGYRTVYARLSSQTHADAEDTLNYVFFRVLGDEKLFLRMAQETVAFSEYLIGYGAVSYLSAMRHFCEVFQLLCPGAITTPTERIVGRMKEIGDLWQW